MKNEGVNRSRLAWAAGGAAVLLGAVLTLGVDSLDHPGDIRLAALGLGRALERARLAGIPIDKADLPPRLALPASQDATNAIQVLAASQHAWADASTDLIRALHAGDRQGAIDALDRLDRVLAVCDDLKSARFVPYDRSPLDLAPVMDPARGYSETLSMAMVVRALVSAERGDVDAALSDLKGLQNLARIAGTDYAAGGSAREAAIRSDAADTARRLANYWQNDPEKLARLSAAFQILPPPPCIPNLQLEAYKAILAMRTFGDKLKLPREAAKSIDVDWKRYDPEAMPRTARGKAFLARVLDAYSEIFEAIQKHPGDHRSARKAAARVSYTFAMRQEPSFLPAKELLFQFSEAGDFTDYAGSVLAKESIAAAAISVLRWRAKHGRLPGSLAEAGIHTSDPFSGSRLRYSALEDEFKIWSVGQDGKDDSGRTPYQVGRPAEEGVLPGDITAEFPISLRRKDGPALQFPMKDPPRFRAGAGEDAGEGSTRRDRP